VCKINSSPLSHISFLAVKLNIRSQSKSRSTSYENRGQVDFCDPCSVLTFLRHEQGACVIGNIRRLKRIYNWAVDGHH